MKSADATARAAPLPRASARRSAAELEFLPAALEIVETPASPAGRTIALTISLCFAAALVWASLGSVDVIATAPGRIVPTGRVKTIQPFETGVVRAIHVQDGQVVKAGDVLLELDPTINAAERDRLQKELTAQRLDAARLRAVLESPDDPESAFMPPAGAPAAQVALQRSLLLSQADEFHARLAGLDRQLAKNEANRAAVAATVAKLTAAVPLLRLRADARKYLADKEVGSKLQYYEIQQSLVEYEHELTVQKSRLAETAAALAALQEQHRQTEAEFRRINLAALAEAEQKAAALEEELVKAQQHQDLQQLKAPVDGAVQQLAVHTLGGVVTPAQPLMVIVPADSRLQIEAMVSNHDIGFVHAGQTAEIKIDTFNFTRYGLATGEVVSVSQDAIVRDKTLSTAARAPTDTSEPVGQDMVYAAHVSLDRSQMQIEDKLVNLSPGMAVTVEIRTGSRRVIEYLLSPLLRYQRDSLRER